MSALLRFAPPAFLLAALVVPVSAHEARPGYLQLTEVAPNTLAMVFKVPAMGDRRFGLYPRVPAHWEAIAPPLAYIAGGAVIEMTTFECLGDPTGDTITIDGLDSTLTDVLVRIERLDGSTQVERLSPSSPSFVIEAAPDRLQVAATYTALGIKHILLGIDHLLFVACLMFVAGSGRRLLVTITGFTIAHSITLALSALDLVRLPVPPVEAVIALSIVFLAMEIARGKRDSLTYRYPIAVSASFGLLHGFGFAAVLREIGLPQTEIPVALLCFNLGVEIGQLLFVSVAFGMLTILRRYPISKAPAARQFFPYAVGSIAAFWVIERVSFAFQGFG